MGWTINFRLKNEMPGCLFVNDYFPLEVYVKSGCEVVHDVSMFVEITCEVERSSMRIIDKENLKMYTASESDPNLPHEFLPHNQIETNQGAAYFLLNLQENLVSSKARFRISARFHQCVLNTFTDWFKVYRYKLEIIRQPDSTFYKDEGGYKNMLETVVGLKDMLHGKSPADKSMISVPITVKLAYEAGFQSLYPSKQKILYVKYLQGRTVGSGHCVTLSFRINEVSRNHFNGKKFRLKISGDSAADPKASNVCHCFTSPIQVFSRYVKARTPIMTGKRVICQENNRYAAEKTTPEPVQLSMSHSISSVSDISRDESGIMEWAKSAVTVLKELEHIQLDSAVDSHGKIITIFGCSLCHQHMNMHTNEVHHLGSCRLGQSLLLYTESFEKSSDDSSNDAASRSKTVYVNPEPSQLSPIDIVCDSTLASFPLQNSPPKSIDFLPQGEGKVAFILGTDLFMNDPTKLGMSTWAAYDIMGHFCGLYFYKFDESFLQFRPMDASLERDCNTFLLNQRLKDAICNNELVLQKICYESREALLAQLLANLL